MANTHSQADHMHQETGFDDTHSMHHIVSPKVYLVIITILLILTVFTVRIAYHDWGALWLNVTIALTVAIIKATFVVLYFMHVRWSGKLIHVTIGASLLFFLVMIAGVLMDQSSRATTVQRADALTFGPSPDFVPEVETAGHDHAAHSSEAAPKH